MFSTGLSLTEGRKKVKFLEKFGNLNISLTGACISYLKCFTVMLFSHE